MEIPRGNTRKIAEKQNPKCGFKSPEYIVRIHATSKWLKFKYLRHESFYVKKRNTFNCSHYAPALESLPIPSNRYRIAIWPGGCLRSSVQKKDRDCGDNTQRDEDEERDPHANRNAVGKRVTTGWHSHESREPFVEFHGFQSLGRCLIEGIEVRPELYCQAINLWRFVSNVESDGLQFSRVVTLRVYGVQTAS
jgi:hypothetical protein